MKPRSCNLPIKRRVAVWTTASLSAAPLSNKRGDVMCLYDVMGISPAFIPRSLLSSVIHITTHTQTSIVIPAVCLLLALIVDCLAAVVR